MTRPCDERQVVAMVAAVNIAARSPIADVFFVALCGSRRMAGVIPLGIRKAWNASGLAANNAVRAPSIMPPMDKRQKYLIREVLFLE